MARKPSDTMGCIQPLHGQLEGCRLYHLSKRPPLGWGETPMECPHHHHFQSHYNVMLSSYSTPQGQFTDPFLGTCREDSTSAREMCQQRVQGTVRTSSKAETMKENGVTKVQSQTGVAFSPLHPPSTALCMKPRQQPLTSYEPGASQASHTTRGCCPSWC